MLKPQKNQSDKFGEEIATYAKAANLKMKEMEDKVALQALLNKTEVADVVLNVENMKLQFFKFCCRFLNTTHFDTAFALYRDFMVQYHRVMDAVDDKCILSFGGDIRDVSIKIRDEKSFLQPVSNDNLSEHNAIHRHNEPHYKIIQEYNDMRLRLLQNDMQNI